MRAAAAKGGILSGAVAAGLLSAAVYMTYQRYKPVLLWRSSAASVTESAVQSRHDGEGRLKFFVRTAFTYSTPAGMQSSAADSDFQSLDYAAVRRRLETMESSRAVKVYYHPAQPDKLRFGAEWSLEYLGQASYYYAGAALAGLMGVAIPVLWKPTRTCRGCKTKLKQHYRFCTFCGAPGAPSTHLTTNERSVET